MPMLDDLDNDLAEVFFSPDDFGAPCVRRRAGAADLPFSAIIGEQSAALFRVCEDLQTALHNAPAADGGIDVARWYRAEIAARTQQAGELINQLETIVDAACWPYPTYADILFSV